MSRKMLLSPLSLAWSLCCRGLNWGQAQDSSSLGPSQLDKLSAVRVQTQ